VCVYFVCVANYGRVQWNKQDRRLTARQPDPIVPRTSGELELASSGEREVGAEPALDSIKASNPDAAPATVIELNRSPCRHQRQSHCETEYETLQFVGRRYGQECKLIPLVSPETGPVYT
jgi:hypothetical protein